MLILEAEVFEFGLDVEQAEAIGQRGIDVERFAGNFILLVGGHGAEGAHVVESVGNLDEHHTDILAHGQQQLAEVFGLQRCLVAENAARNLGQAADKLGNLGAELLLDVLNGVVGIFNHIVEKCGAYRGRAQTDFLRGNLGHGDWVENIRLARATSDAAMSFLGKSEGALDYLHLLAVVAIEIAVEHILKFCLDQAVFLFRRHLLKILIHRRFNL